MAGRLEWHGDKILAAIHREMVARIYQCCSMLVTHTKQMLSVSGTRTGGGRDTKGRFKRKYGANPSAPGEPPHKQLGHLRRSIDKEVDATTMTGRVGTNLLYGLWLELGTRLMKARPFLRRALTELRDAILRILTAPMPGP